MQCPHPLPCPVTIFCVCHTPLAHARRVSHDAEPPDFYDTRLDSVRPRTVGYSPGHVRALSPTPCLTWGGRESSRASLEWGEGTGGSLGAVEACLGGTRRGGGSTTGRPNGSCRVRTYCMYVCTFSKCISDVFTVSIVSTGFFKYFYKTSVNQCF